MADVIADLEAAAQEAGMMFRQLDAVEAAVAEIKQLRAALAEIADDPCIDPEGNRQIALKALGRVNT